MDLVEHLEMMELKSTFKVAFTDQFGAVELPYKNNKFSMYLFLPAEGSNLEKLAGSLDGQTWKAWLEKFAEREKFTITMPKFKFEYERVKEGILLMAWGFFKKVVAQVKAVDDVNFDLMPGETKTVRVLGRHAKGRVTAKAWCSPHVATVDWVCSD